MHYSINDHASILITIRKKLWAQKETFAPKKIKKKCTKNNFFGSP